MCDAAKVWGFIEEFLKEELTLGGLEEAKMFYVEEHQTKWKTVWRLLKKLGIKLSYDPVIPLLGMYPQETIIEKDTCTPVFIAALFTIART